ncbi:uncharacterized protein PAC_06336 [Phialocephala subalpina]|uniref:Uncharacterized protein n=1 Tax=Phialocephala subalpina TaxID=576137 RepID=A0A1L7WUK5_9HELO|nr:uncharacterized protein PAC_06336 [Phialocephala subalpina]
MNSSSSDFSPATIAITLLSMTATILLLPTSRTSIRRFTSNMSIVGADSSSTTTAEVDSTRCYDWINTLGPCHYAKIVLPSRLIVRSIRPSTGRTKVTGVGTVELEVRKRPNNNETGRTVLYTVLHVPSAIRNTFNSTPDGNEGVGVNTIMDDTPV